MHHSIALAEALHALSAYVIELRLQLVHLLLCFLELLLFLPLFLAYLLVFLFGLQIRVVLLELSLLVRDYFVQLVGGVVDGLLVGQFAHAFVNKLLVYLNLFLFVTVHFGRQAAPALLPLDLTLAFVL